MQIKVINKSAHPLPNYATIGSSGVDLYANIENCIKLEPFQRELIATGIFLEIPAGFEAQVRPRSGLALKKGLTCLNTPGTIDSDYRGEIKVIIINLSNNQQQINPGEKIAQLVFQSIVKISWQEVPVISETNRNDGGFGHTDKNKHD